MSASNLIALNAFRAAEGKAPLTAWKASRHNPMLADYVAASRISLENVGKDHFKVQTTKDIVAHGVRAARVQEVAAPHVMRPLNEELGADIKATREAWRASGAGITKKEYVVGLLEVGATIKTIVDKMGVTETAARSLIGDVRRMPGYTVRREGDMYFVDAPDMGDEGEDDGE